MERGVLAIQTQEIRRQNHSSEWDIHFKKPLYAKKGQIALLPDGETNMIYTRMSSIIMQAPGFNIPTFDRLILG